jgi:hypothetical protein
MLYLQVNNFDKTDVYAILYMQNNKKNRYAVIMNRGRIEKLWKF